jgi:hypothetical protein
MNRFGLGALVFAIAVVAAGLTMLSGCGEDRHHKVYVEREHEYEGPVIIEEGRHDHRGEGDRREEIRRDGERREGDRHEEGERGEGGRGGEGGHGH